jgi:hypothetical protein
MVAMSERQLITSKAGPGLTVRNRIKDSDCLVQVPSDNHEQVTNKQ